MENNASKLLMAEGLQEDAIGFERSLDICFEGQRYYVETSVPRWKDDERERFLMEAGLDPFLLVHETRDGSLAREVREKSGIPMDIIEEKDPFFFPPLCAG